MSHLLRCRHTIGEQRKYRVTVSMMMNDPEHGELLGQVIEEQIFETVSGSPPNWEVRCSRILVQLEGPLATRLPPDRRQSSEFHFQASEDGGLTDLGQGLPARVPRFPLEAVEVGSSWQHIDQRPGESALTITHSVAGFSDHSDDLRVELLSSAAASQGSGQDVVRVEVQSATSFAVGAGQVVSSKTVVDSTWPNGRRTRTSVEMELV